MPAPLSTPSLAAFALAAILAVPAPTWSSPLEDTTLGGAVFTGPAHPHATALYINPAALGLDSQGTHIYLDGSLRVDQLSVERTIRDQDGNTSSATPVDAVTLAPGGTLAIYNVGSKVSAGVALGVPQNDQFIENDGELGYHVLEGHHRRIAWLTLAISFRLTSRIRFGTGLSLGSTSMKLSFLRDTALEGGPGPDGIGSDCNGSPCGIENPDAAERYDIEVSTPGALATQNIGLSFGLMYQVAQDWWLGIGVQSPVGFRSSLSLRGTATITPAPRDQRGPDPRVPYEADTEVVYELPQSVAVGVRGPIFPGFELIAGARWQNFSRHDVIDLRIFGGDANAPGDAPEWYPRYRGLRDVLVLEGGLEGSITGSTRIGGRLRVETGAAAADTLSPIQIAGPNATLVGGLEHRFGDGNNVVVSGSYGLTWFPTTTVTTSKLEPSHYLDCVEQQLDIDACAPAAQGRGVPSAAGTYGRLSHGARVAIRYHFF